MGFSFIFKDIFLFVFNNLEFKNNFVLNVKILTKNFSEKLDKTFLKVIKIFSKKFVFDETLIDYV